MREMRRIGVGMRGMRWECGCGELTWDCRETGENAKHVGNQGGGARNQGGNLSIAVEMT